MHILDGLHHIVGLYDGFLIDLWGVVHNGINPYPGTVACINDLIARNKQVLFLSNIPRPNIVAIKKLIDFNINATPDMMLTSGDLTRDVLQQTTATNQNTKYYHLGAHRNTDILFNLNINIVTDIQQADAILLTAYIEADENLHQFDELLTQAAAYNLPMICANPDYMAVQGTQDRYCAGFISQQYEQLGGTVTYYGKPYIEIYTQAFARINQTANNIPLDRILMIGDTIETDILGAKNSGIKSALVLTGNTGNILQTKYRELSAAAGLQQLFADQRIAPDHVLMGLK